MRPLIRENLIKNILLIVILISLYFPIQSYLLNNQFYSDSTSVGNLMIAVSLIAVIACFGNFEFKYENINMKKKMNKLLAHLTSGLLMLIIGISLIFISVLIDLIIGNFLLAKLTLVVLYLACIIYDFLDLLRIEDKYTKII